MRILFLNNEFPPLGGGTGTVNYHLFTHLSERKEVNIDFVTSAVGKKNEFYKFSDNIQIYKVAINNKNIHHSSNSELIKYSIKAIIKSYKLSKNNKYDIIFAYSTVPAGFVAYVLHILFHIPFIIRIGGPDIPGFEQRYTLIYKIISPIIKLIWRKAAEVIVKCKQEYEMVKAAEKRVEPKIVYNGVDTKKFIPKKNKKLNDPPLIICSARLIKRKGQDILLKALYELKKRNILFYLDLVGTGDEEENYKTMVKQLDIQEIVRFNGYVDRKNIHIYYQNADLFVLPSYNEGMSNSLLEAMACGLPVVVTDVGGSDELVQNGVNGFIFDKGDTNALIRILEKFYRNKQLFMTMGQKSAKKASEFSWKKITDQTLRLIRSNVKTVGTASDIKDI